MSLPDPPRMWKLDTPTAKPQRNTDKYMKPEIGGLILDKVKTQLPGK